MWSISVAWGFCFPVSVVGVYAGEGFRIEVQPAPEENTFQADIEA